MFSPRLSIASLKGTCTIDLSAGPLRTALQESVGKNNFYQFQLLVLAWISLLNDSPVDSLKPKGVIRKFVWNLCERPFVILESFSSLSDSLVNSLENNDGDVTINEFLDFSDTPVFREYHQFTKTRDPQLLKYLLTFLNFGSKVHYDNDNLNTNALRDWFEVEERISRVELPSWISNLKKILDWTFQDWDFQIFLPKHGSGSVAEREVHGIKAKEQSYGHDSRISYLYRDSIFFNHDIPDTYSSSELIQNDVRYATSRLMFVPKNWKKTRSICMEPVTLQWAQQGVRLVYEHALATSWMGKHVPIKDQTLNQQAAAFGSSSSLMDTVDLSSASDSVAWKLVKTIFPSKVLKHLTATRSRIVELPNGENFEASKFAPMGSALCFPVQSTIYSAIVMMVSAAMTYGRDWRVSGIFDDLDMDLVYEHTFGKYQKIQKKHQPFKCYGDDIICDRRVTSSLIEALTSLGFKVNVGKTFTGNQAYRESCGKHYLIGSDVTPLTFKIKDVAKKVSIETMASIIELANHCREYEYASVRRLLIRFILYSPIQGYKNKGTDDRNEILFTTDPNESFSILCDAPKNHHLNWRFFNPSYSFDDTSCRYQRDEVKSITIGPRQYDEYTSKEDLYLHNVWWRSRLYGDRNTIDNQDSIPCKADTLGVGIRRRWTAAGA